ncbi:MAG: T9SS type A sorting domain-containing protein [Candidatus Krumholzibacteria bacterium]|nr:T9SS type A sorting domain-containing protein [Candidatus Krumholzibacteria bacterium]
MNRRALTAMIGIGLMTVPLLSLAQLPADLYLATTAPDALILGASTFHRTAYGFAQGDFNGDGKPDLAVLSDGEDSADGYAFVSVLWGPPPLQTTTDLLTYANVSIVKAPPGELGSLSRLVAGDFNGDAVDDIAFSAPCHYSNGNCDGTVYVVFGTVLFPDTLDLISGTSPGSMVLRGRTGIGGALGMMLDSGDINRDGLDDLLISAPLGIPPTSEVYMLWGATVLPDQISMNDAAPGVTRFIDSRTYQSSGRGLAWGDVDGDKWPDLVIGSPGEGQDNGEVTILFGGDEFPDSLLLATQPPGSKRFRGAGLHDQAGYRVAVVDMNGDGCGELVVSSYRAQPNGCDACGEVEIVRGGASLPATAVLAPSELPMLRLLGDPTISVGALGVELSTGDVNADGFGDVMLTTKSDLLNPSNVGYVSVVYGTFTLPDSIHVGSGPGVTRIHGVGHDDRFGMGLAAFDMNGDGVDDLLLGAPYASPLGRYQAGTASIVYGQAWSTGVASTPALRLLPNRPNPFSIETTIGVTLPNQSEIDVAIFDAQGRLVRHVADGVAKMGEHAFRWDGRDEQGRLVASGVYFCRVKASQQTAVSKLVLVR